MIMSIFSTFDEFLVPMSFTWFPVAEIGRLAIFSNDILSIKLGLFKKSCLSATNSTPIGIRSVTELGESVANYIAALWNFLWIDSFHVKLKRPSAECRVFFRPVTWNSSWTFREKELSTFGICSKDATYRKMLRLTCRRRGALGNTVAEFTFIP